jgi:hypothetical protein
MTADAPVAAPDIKGPVIARAGKYYRVTRYIMTFILFVYGGWSIYDGFISWPNWPITHPNEMPKTPMDILFNKVLGCILPPAGIFLLIRCIHNSRGEYRLEDGVVHVPGYPPIPLSKIHAVDRELWDRKGIAYVAYELPPGTAKDPKLDRDEFILDDFVYEREPIDKIFAAIEASLLKDHPLTASAPAPAEPKPPAPAAKAAAPAPRPVPAAAPRPVPTQPRPAPAVAKPAPVVAKPVAKPANPAPSPKPAPPPGVMPTKMPPRPKL